MNRRQHPHLPSHPRRLSNATARTVRNPVTIVALLTTAQAARTRCTTGDGTVDRAAAHAGRT